MQWNLILHHDAAFNGFSKYSPVKFTDIALLKINTDIRLGTRSLLVLFEEFYSAKIN